MRVLYDAMVCYAALDTPIYVLSRDTYRGVVYGAMHDILSTKRYKIILFVADVQPIGYRTDFPLQFVDRTILCIACE